MRTGKPFQALLAVVLTTLTVGCGAERAQEAPDERSRTPDVVDSSPIQASGSKDPAPSQAVEDRSTHSDTPTAAIQPSPTDSTTGVEAMTASPEPLMVGPKFPGVRYEPQPQPATELAPERLEPPMAALSGVRRLRGGEWSAAAPQVDRSGTASTGPRAPVSSAPGEDTILLRPNEATPLPYGPETMQPLVEPIPAMAPSEYQPATRETASAPRLDPDRESADSTGSTGSSAMPSVTGSEVTDAGSDTARSPASSTELDNELVTVFYGTDRKALGSKPSRAPAYITWLYITVACAGMTVILALFAVRSRGAATKALLAISLLATVALGGITVVARTQAKSTTAAPSRSYGNQRGVLETGTCQVSIPKRHQLGHVERPTVIRFEFEEDPTKHIVLMEVLRQDDEAFFESLRSRVNQSHDKEAFVFVHGYNVTFDAAARRTAQLAYDLKFDGAPIFFSWPSQGGLLKYSVDETNAAWTAPHLADFITSVARKSGAESVHLIAHSMGNRALTSALKEISYELQENGPIFNEVVLTAPDIDADVFKRDIAPRIVKTARRVTLYASSNDEALAFSKKVHGYPRAGESGSGLVVVPGVDTIDVSAVDTSLIGHSYYGSNRTVLADLIDLLHESRPPDLRRWLNHMTLDNLAYWVFVPDPPDSVSGSFAPVR